MSGACNSVRMSLAVVGVSSVCNLYIDPTAKEHWVHSTCSLRPVLLKVFLYLRQLAIWEELEGFMSTHLSPHKYLTNI